jgi:hypothetical protein
VTWAHKTHNTEIHKLLAKRIFLHVGSDEVEDVTFVFLCKSSCSSGHAGLVLGREALVIREALSY